MKELSGRKPCRLIAILRGWSRKYKAGGLGRKEAGGKKTLWVENQGAPGFQVGSGCSGGPIFRFVAKWTMRPVSG